MLGMATLTMLTSSSAMKPATRQMISAFHRIGSGASVTCGAGVVGVVTAPSSVSVFLPAHGGHEVADGERDICDVQPPCRPQRFLERRHLAACDGGHLQPGGAT